MLTQWCGIAKQVLRRPHEFKIRCLEVRCLSPCFGLTGCLGYAAAATSLSGHDEDFMPVLISPAAHSSVNHGIS